MERTKQGEFTWTDLSASDLQAQSDFYESLFGWSHTDLPLGDGAIYRMFSIDGHTIGGASQMNPDMAAQGVPSMWNTYIAVDDVDAEAAKAVELGGTIVVPPMDVMDRGRMVGIQDPTGAMVFLWHTNSPDASETYSEPGALAWTDLETREPEKAADFFSKLVGWDINAMNQGPMPYWQINVDGQGEGGIMPMPEMIPAEVPAYWLDYFGTADIDESVSRAKDLGATVTVDPTKVGDTLSFAILSDPKGATFALLQSTGNM